MMEDIANRCFIKEEFRRDPAEEIVNKGKTRTTDGWNVVVRRMRSGKR
jgi:hypothetical protein